jgi:hypothetical protein
MATFLLIIFRFTINEVYSGVLAFMRQCLAVASVASTDSLGYVPDVTAKEAVEMRVTQNIIHNSSGEIIIIGLNGIIGSVSLAAISIRYETSSWCRISRAIQVGNVNLVADSNRMIWSGYETEPGSFWARFSISNSKLGTPSQIPWSPSRGFETESRTCQAI